MSDGPISRVQERIRERVPKRSLSFAPNLFTVGNMALGFFSILSVLSEKYYQAAVVILFAHVLDILDGRVARWTGTQSKFGVEFDSLADWISFGVAPAVLMYDLVLSSYGELGMALSALYVICAALRLARFNLQAHEGAPPTPYFVGLPTPAAGGILAVFVLLYQITYGDVEARTIALVMKQIPLLEPVIPAAVFLLALLMISSVRYSTFKQLRFLRPRTRRSLIITLLVAFMIYVYPQNTIFILYVSYIGWGIMEYFWSMAAMRRRALKAGFLQNKQEV